LHARRVHHPAAVRMLLVNLLQQICAVLPQDKAYPKCLRLRGRTLLPSWPWRSCRRYTVAVAVELTLSSNSQSLLSRHGSSSHGGVALCKPIKWCS
jgi:hypothetical protein